MTLTTVSQGPTPVVILGAAGRDFHNFNVVYRDNPAFRVVAFTATQIPGIGGRLYPAALAGPLYPDGIPIIAESALESTIQDTGPSQVVFSYSDVTHATVMHLASRALAGGADFTLLGPERTMLRSRLPVIAVSAIRTGCGKSQVARYLSRLVRERGLHAGIIRHPMPYGDLARQRVQRFASRADLSDARCTLEEREEYEPHIAAGNVVWAGVDYAAILAAAEAESDLIIWDGGNNDFPFVKPHLHVVLADALRPGQAATHHPGEAVLRMADVIVVAKADSATAPQVAAALAEVRALNARAPCVRGGSPVTLDDAAAVRGQRVLVIEDGPTLTHGGMPHGAAYAAATRAGAVVVDPRPRATPGMAAILAANPHIGPVLPAMGYSTEQVADLRAMIDVSDADIVVAGTPIDLAALTGTGKRVIRARYEFAEIEQPGLKGHIEAFLARGRRGRA